MTPPKEWMILRFEKGYDVPATYSKNLLTHRQMINKLKKLIAASPGTTFTGKNLKTHEVFHSELLSEERHFVIQKFNNKLKLFEFFTSLNHLYTYKEVKEELKKIEAQYPGEEFRGHNYVICKQRKEDPYKP